MIKEHVIDMLIKFMVCTNNRKRPKEWSFVEETLAELWRINGTQSYDAYDEMQSRLVALANDIKQKIRQGFDEKEWHTIVKTMVEFCGVENIKAKFPGYKQGNYLGNLLNKFEGLFFSEYMETNSDWDLAIENFCGKHSIPIMTIHKSKGLEYSAVYFIGLEDSAFWNFRNRPEEERCAFFVAISRAKGAITFTFCKQRTGTKYPIQQHKVINEFFELLQMPGVAEVKNISSATI